MWKIRSFNTKYNTIQCELEMAKLESSPMEKRVSTRWILTMNKTTSYWSLVHRRKVSSIDILLFVREVQLAFHQTYDFVFQDEPKRPNPCKDCIGHLVALDQTHDSVLHLHKIFILKWLQLMNSLVNRIECHFMFDSNKLVILVIN